LRGKVNSWASGIVRTIGWVNYLDDPASEPHLDLSEIDQAFGVSKSTGQAKSLEIRKLLKIYPFDLEWTVPGRLGENPLAWMVESGGFLIDMRHMPREIQEAAFAQGLIPYIPGEEPGKAPEKSRNGKAKQTDTGPLYQFKITLLGVKPPIWRRIQVQDCTLHQFHEHIQTAMGWTNSHLHQFEIKKTIYSPPSPMGEFDDDLQGEDSTKVLLSELLPKRNKGFRLRYEYDFGDGWQHEVICEGTHQPEPGQKYPLCLQGKRACPPEDVGGSWGYADYLQALADPRHSEHNELLEWGGKFDPEAFDPVEQTRSMRAGMPSWF
jgi:hypothetical protein